jgi:hypothetical protein
VNTPEGVFQNEPRRIGALFFPEGLSHPAALDEIERIYKAMGKPALLNSGEDQNKQRKGGRYWEKPDLLESDDEGRPALGETRPSRERWWETAGTGRDPTYSRGMMVRAENERAGGAGE